MKEFFKNLYIKETDPALLEDYQKADSFLFKLSAICWFLISTASAVFYDTYLLGFISGGLVFLFTFISYKYYSGTPIFRILIGILLMTYTIISIQQNYGRIEMHFFVFISLSFLTVYKDIKPITVTAIFIILHHLFFTYLQLNAVTFLNMPVMVYNYGCSYDIALLHAFYVAFEWIILYKIICSSIKNYMQINQVQTKLLDMNDALQDKQLQLEKADQHKSDFLANMSHEIRTPMNGVYGIAQLLEQTKLTRDQNHYVSTLLRSSKTLLTIINDILDFSKIESGNLHIESSPFELLREIREACDLLRPQAKDKLLALSLKIPKQPIYVCGDSTRLRQVLINLLDNAIKFTQDGSVSFELIIKQRSDTDIKVEFIITDTGIGIAEDKLKDIFVQFSQADSSTTRQYGGTGLGLTISKQLVELMGGQLKVVSRESIGSEFSFVFTMPLTGKERVTPIESNSLIKLSGLVLLVEDDKTNSLIAEMLLQQAGVEVINAENGLVAIDLFARHNIDLILMDMQMPVMGGVEATKKIRSQFPDKSCPIIAMTANVLQEHRELCFNAGMNDFISKPINSKEFRNTLSKYLAAK
jgi:signal transduction histidine kinase/ActR/RegA family two-component response regulator